LITSCATLRHVIDYFVASFSLIFAASISPALFSSFLSAFSYQRFRRRRH
jgi:hypothetical protein